MKAFVLCAGKGERLKPFTDALAKPAIPFLNIPMMYYSIWALKKLGIRDFLINTHHLPDSIEHTITKCPDKNLTFKTYFEESLLGSEGPIAKAEDFLEQDDHFVLANGDSVFLLHNDKVLQKFLDFHKANKAMATIFLTPHNKETQGFGSVWVDAKNRVRGFGKTNPDEKTETDPMHFVGLIVMNKKCLEWFEVKNGNIFYDVFTKHLANQNIMGFISREITWHETGNIQSYLDALTQIQLLLTRRAHSQGEEFMRKDFHEMLNAFHPGTRLSEKTPTTVPKNIHELIDLNKSLLK